MRRSPRSLYFSMRALPMNERLRKIALIGIIFAGLTACSPAQDFEDNSEKWDEDVSWPSLLPTQTLNALIAEKSTNNAGAIAAQTSLEQRARALQNRANALRRSSVLSASDRRTLLSALARQN